jgi:hypothetical protein
MKSFFGPEVSDSERPKPCSPSLKQRTKFITHCYPLDIHGVGRVINITNQTSPTIKQRFIALGLALQFLPCFSTVSDSSSASPPIPTIHHHHSSTSQPSSQYLNMHGPYLSYWPISEAQAWTSVVQPCVASTHLPAYNIIGAAPRLRCAEDEVPIRPVTRRNKSSSSSSSLRKKTAGGVGAKRTDPVTRENLFKISMACAREEDLDAPFSIVPAARSSERRTRTGSETSTSASSSDLPSITEEEE